MKKHVEGEHSPLVKRLAKDPNCITVAKAPTDRNTNKKRAHVFPFEIFGFFSTSS
jgi:hypothetical protein